MKLVVYIHSLSCGGAERVAANLASHWAGAGWNVTVITTADARDDFYTLHPAVQRLSLVQHGGERVLGGLRRALRRTLTLRRELKRLQPDVVLSIMQTSNVTLACAAFGLKQIVTVASEQIHPPSEPVTWPWATLRRYTYAWLSTVVALTAESAAWLRSNTRAARVCVIPSAAVWPLPVHPPVVAPAELIPSEKRVLLAVGRLVRQKQLEHLVDAFGSLAMAHPDWLLVILGDGPLRQPLEAQSAARGLSGRSFLPGRVGNMGDWYERADLYVMTSQYEGFPNSLAEAMAHGLPVISYDCDTGPRDLIRHEVDGVLVPAGEIGTLVKSLSRLMGDDDSRRAFAIRALEARERLSIGRVAAMWESLLRELKESG